MTTVSSTVDSLGLGATQSQGKKDTLGQEQFLSLMLTQLQNQDPFKPMESGDFLGQIAQFGTVSGIQDLQASFNSFAASIYSNQALEVSGLVGKQVAVESSVGYLAEDAGLSGSVGLPNSATQVRVGVYDRSGVLVRNMILGPQPAGLVAFEWDGLADDGTAMPPGQYQVIAEASMGEEVMALPTLINAHVDSVLFSGNGQDATLELSGLGNWNFSDVRQIRDAAPSTSEQNSVAAQ